MIQEIGKGMTTRNPVWVVPLALPVTLFATTSWEMTLLFSGAVVFSVIGAHLLSIPLERWFPPDLSILALLMAAAVMVSIAERGLYAFGIILPTRPLYLFRAISVSGVMLWPALIGSRNESVSRRMYRVLGLALGFVSGLLLLTAVRTPFIAGGFLPANSVAFGLLLLAVGRIAVNQVLMIRERSTDGHGSGENGGSARGAGKRGTGKRGTDGHGSGENGGRARGARGAGKRATGKRGAGKRGTDGHGSGENGGSARGAGKRATGKRGTGKGGGR